MSRKIAAGAAGGLIAGLVLDGVMRILPATGGATSMVGYAGGLVHAGPASGWIVYPVYGVLIGWLFGALLRHQALDIRRASLIGALYGVIWWILAGLLLVPAGLEHIPLSSAAVDAVRPVALPLLIGHLVYGAVLGACWAAIVRRRPLRHRTVETAPSRRAA